MESAGRRGTNTASKRRRRVTSAGRANWTAATTLKTGPVGPEEELEEGAPAPPDGEFVHPG